MKGLCVYIKAGQGHYIPAKAVYEQMIKKGVDCHLVDFFDYMDLERSEKMNQSIWRLMLKFPFIEKHLFRRLDGSGISRKLLLYWVGKLRIKKLKKNIEEFHPDFIFATHPYPGTILSTLLNSMGEDIPVYFYSTDVFSSPKISICPFLRKHIISTEEGLERVVALGQKKESMMLAPFPLQSAVADYPRLEKKEARRKLSLDEEKFTIELNLGGEGLGSLALLKEIIKRDLPVQVVIVGGIRKNMEKHLRRIISEKGENTVLEIRGFVTNVNEYLYASDLIVGRAGINTILEAIYAHRPFLITELVYIVKHSAEYVEKYKVGWNATGDVEKQINIIEDLACNPEKLCQMENNFRSVPIEYNAKRLAEMVIDDARHIK